MKRIMIRRGQWHMDIDLGVAAGVADLEHIPFILHMQLYDERGELARGEYDGPATVVDRGSERFLVLGDPQRSTQLPEYRIGEATAETARELADAERGFLAGRKSKTDRKPKRASGESYEWHRGWEEARKAKPA